MDAFDLAERGEKDIEKLGIEMFAAMLAHQIDGMIEIECRFVDPGSGEGVERVRD
jgi:hypothetical protein